VNPPDDQNLLRESEEKYRALVETTGTGYVIIDSEGRVLDANREYIRLSGHEALEEIRGRRVTEWTAPHDLARNAEEVGKCMERGFVHNLEIDYVNKDGKVIPVEINATVLPMAEGTRIVTLCRDITERRRVETALKESEEQFRLLVENQGEGIGMADLEERFTFANPAAEAIFGVPPGKLVGRRLEDFMTPEQYAGVLEQTWKRNYGERSTYDLEIVRADGERRSLLVTACPRNDPQGRFIGTFGIFRDITERKRMEEALKTSEERFRTAAGSLTDVVYEWDLKEKLDWFGDIDGLMGYPAGGFPRTIDGWAAAIHPDDQDRVKGAIEGQLKSAVPYAVEYRVRKKDGKWRWWSARGTALRDERGEPYKWIGAITDVTERRRAEEALQESEQRFKAIFDHSNDGILLADMETKRFFIGNETICQMLGCSPDEIKDLGVMDIHPPEDLPYVVDQFEKQARKEIAVAKDLPVKRKDGSIFYADVSAFPITLTGKPYLVGAFRDTTERKRVEEFLQEQKEELEAANEDLQQSRDALRESEGKHRTLLENLPQKIFFKDRSSVYVVCNENYARDLKVPSDEIQGRTDHDFFPRELAEKYRSDDRRIMESGRTEELEERYLQEGQERWVYTIKTPVKNEAGEVVGILGIFWDTTERKNLEAQLIQSQKMEAVGLLAGGIAHEFNNILGGILGYASLMRLKMEPDHPFWGYVETIEKSSQRAALLTSQLLGFARKGKYDLRLLNLNLLAEDTLAIVRQTFDRAVTVEARLAEGLPKVEGDTMQLQQVLMNLCINARDAMPKGGSLVLTTRTEQVAEGDERIPLESKPGLYVLLSVADTGCGMDEETLAKIFEPFFTTKEKGKGTGLGLAMVYGVVKNHGGFVTVRSEVGLGSAFTLHLPAAEKPSERRPEALAAPEKSRGAVSDQTILVVDDEESIRSLARDILEGEGYRVLLAENGARALEVYREHQGEIGLVVLDLIMPKLGGGEVFLKLKEMDPGVHVLVSSGYSQEGKAQEILSGGALGFVQKPFHVRDLISQVRQGLDGGGIQNVK
jgi:PAS domain S-box-containing protein